MAIGSVGERAALVASIELEDRFSKTADTVERRLGSLERQTSTVGRVGTEVGRGLQSAATNLTKIGVVAGGVIAYSVQQGVQSLQRLEEVTVATNAVIESTGGVAGQTGEDIRQLAEKYEALNATMDDKVIQSGENLLLTFTNIRDDAFEPALEAALNLNQAMGGGEEGLESTIIQVGKALNDPIRGVANLRRVGVQLSEQQEDQIRTLVEQNDLYGAQQIILDELSTQFGGQFAAAGDTATGRMAKFRDAVEDAQMSLATAFLPVLEKVADKATTFLSDPEVQTQIAEFGEGLAGGLEQVIEFAGKLPWSSIGDAFRIAGTGARAVLDAFTSLPPWIQTAVLTGWGLNKLTGGALGNIGKIAIDVFKNRGSTPANPLFTKEVGLGGVGGAPVGAGGGTLGTLLRGGLAVGLGAIIGAHVADAINEGVVSGARDFAQGEVDAVLSSQDAGRIEHAISVIEDQLQPDDFAAQMALALDVNGVRTTLEGQRDALEAQLDELGVTREEARKAADTQANIAEGARNDANRYLEQLNRQVAAGAAASAAKAAEQIAAIRTTAANTATQLARVEAVERGTQGYTAQVAAKDFSPSFTNTTNVSVNLQAQISAYGIQRALQVTQSAQQTSFSGHGGDSRF